MRSDEDEEYFDEWRFQIPDPVELQVPTIATNHLTMPEPTTEAPPSPAAAPAAAPAPAPAAALPQPVKFTGQPLAADTVLRRLNATPLRDWASRDFFLVRRQYAGLPASINLHDYGEMPGHYVDVMANNMEIMPALHDIALVPHRLVTLYKYGAVSAGTLFTRGAATRRVWHSECRRFTFDLGDYPELTKLLPTFTAPVKDDGHVDERFKPLLARRTLNPMLKAQIENFPTAQQTRGMIRQQLLWPPPPTVTSAAEIFAWIESLSVAQCIAPPLASANTPTPVTRVAVTPAPAPAPAPTPQNEPPAWAALAPVRAVPRPETRALEVVVTVGESGHARWSRTDTYRGRLQIPVDVLDEGEDAVEEFIRENYGQLRRSMGEVDYNDDDGSNDETDIEEIEADIAQLVEDRQEELEDGP